jgi:hypothetical protein
MEAPPIISNARPRMAWWAIASMLAASAGAVALYFFNPSQYAFYPRCMLYVTTGLYCPGCGSQRAVYQLLHGHVLEALRCNVLLVAALPFMVAFAVRWVYCWRAFRPLPQFAPSARMVWWGLAIMLVFTALRNIHVAPFIYLAPP